MRTVSGATAGVPLGAFGCLSGVIANGGVPADCDPVVRSSICSLIDPPLCCLAPAS